MVGPVEKGSITVCHIRKMRLQLGIIQVPQLKINFSGNKLGIKFSLSYTQLRIYVPYFELFFKKIRAQLLKLLF